MLRTPGEALDTSTRAALEPLVGRDLGDVRVHTDSAAAESAATVRARAYTVGSDIVFAAGQFAPTTANGRRLLAHELAHVVQQRAGPAPVNLEVGPTDSPLESDAERSADAVMAGRKIAAASAATVAAARSPIIQRLGDLTKVPAGFPCTVAPSSPGGITDRVLFGNTVTTLTSLQLAQLDNVVTNWRADGASARVRIDGYASTPGTDAMNWQLSCNRALAVEAELRTPSSGAVFSGIPSSFISTFAAGETAEFGPEENNRAVHVFIPTRPTPPPTPPGPPGCMTPINADQSGTAFNPTTSSQNGVIARNPIDAFTVNSLASDAVAAATRSGLPGVHLGPFDAFRHCFWNCRMAQELGAGDAEEFATGHENSGPSPIPFDNQMDLHNNSIGRGLGAPGADCEAACRAAQASGLLRTVRGPHTRSPGSPPVPTDCIGASNQPWP